MHRFFVPPETVCAEEIILPPEVLHHLSTVLRRPAGEEILLLDGTGTICRCRVTALDRRTGAARVLARWREEETAFPIALLQALPKGDKMDLVLQKGTELGIGAFVPVLAARTVPGAGPGEQRLQRWERILREAARQCRRPCLPTIAPPVTLASALAACREELRLFLWEEESRPIAGVLAAARPASAAVLVGPEGGFSPAEAAMAEAAGFVAVSLGQRILRSETAGFAVASILQYRYGDLGTFPAKIPALPRSEVIP